jgi:hypothetical protein
MTRRGDFMSRRDGGLLIGDSPCQYKQPGDLDPMATESRTGCFRLTQLLFDEDVTSLQAAVRTTSALAAGSSATRRALQLVALSGQAVIGVSVKLGCVVVIIAFVTAVFGSGEVRNAAMPKPTARLAAPQAVKPAAAIDPDDPKQAGRFVGRVTGPDDRPLAGARLFVVPHDPVPAKAGPVRAVSGADGRFEFDALDMTYTELDGLPARLQGMLIATADGYMPDWVVTWGQPRGSTHYDHGSIKGADLALRLSRDDVPIHGRLLDHEGRPLAGAQVRLSALMVPWERDLDAHLNKYRRSRNEVWVFDYHRSVYQPSVLPGVTAETVTDADGRFRISGLGQDRLVDLKITAPGVVDTYLRVMTRDAPDVVIDRDSDGYPSRATLGAGFTLRLRRGRTISGVVRDRDTRQPIPGIWVGPGGDAFNGLRTGTYPTVTDAEGRFTISGIDPQIAGMDILAVPSPGQPYVIAKAEAAGPSEAVIECPRGIPFRLYVVDDVGAPVDAEVEYEPVMPNAHLDGLLRGAAYHSGIPPYGNRSLNRAAKKEKGVYEGFVIPGPGAVLVKTPSRPDFRPAHVDPKAFFAPGKADWTAQERISTYGTQDTLMIPYGGVNQAYFAAIVLVNPPVGSKPLQLSTTVFRDSPRQVTLLDPDGKPVVGCQSQGMTEFPWDFETRLRTSTFPITKLHPDHGRRITFVKEDRKLIGFLLARGDSVAPSIVRMQPWGLVTGRILDENGKPAAATELSAASLGSGTSTAENDLNIGEIPPTRCDGEGRFRIERLVPGQRYRAEVYRDAGVAGMAFENLVLQPGEVRDLGDIRTGKPIKVMGR